MSSGLGAMSATDAAPAVSRWSFKRLLPGIIVALETFIGAFSILGFASNLWHQAAVDSDFAQSRNLRAFQVALIDTQSAVRAYLLSPSEDTLNGYLTAERRLAAVDPAVMALLDDTGSASAKPQFEAALIEVLNGWAQAVRVAERRGGSDAAQALEHSRVQAQVNLLRTAVDRAVRVRSTAGTALQRRLSASQVQLLVTVMALTVVAMTAMVVAFRSSDRDARGRERAIVESHAAHDRIEHLFFMADMLQSAASHEDTNAVLQATAAHLLPGFSGAMYVFNNSRDRLDLATRWGNATSEGCAAHFHPDACWALKRGKANINAADAGGLRCDHATKGRVTLEIPMAARGQLHGLIEIVGEGENAERALQEIRPVAMAIGDAMSLSLSGMALRDRLRNQALKDSLTGLYNRRFLEETLDRLCLDAERRRSPLSAIMIDLDHFKRLNDMHGHAMGDNALREVSRAVFACLRSTDVACRYGGEELAVLLPDCPLAMAERKAEQIRAAIADLSVDGVSVTASLGAACLPETSMRNELLAHADAALYQAKQNGRDRVAAAAVRPQAQRFNVVEGRAGAVDAS